MERLLNIKPIPVATELNIQKNNLEYSAPLPKVKVSQQKGGLEIKTNRIQINIDTFEMRQSIGLKSAKTLVNEYCAEGMKKASEATAKFVQEGNQLAQPNGMKPHEMVAQRAVKSIETVLDFLPKARPEITWEGGDVNIDFTPDKINMEWEIGKFSNYNFTYGKVELEVVQKPTVEIEYLGEPRYIPESAKPETK